MPKVSIIVPVYNAEQYLSRCIESIQQQKENDLEIILVDDASTDTSLEICKKYRRLDNRIVVISKKNGGPHSARKTGINSATAQYIAFIDADDWIKPTLISDMLLNIEEFQTDGVICAYSLHENSTYTICANHFSSGKYTKSKLIEKIYSQMLCPNNTFTQKMIPALWGKLFKRCLLLDIMNDLDEDICIGEDLACTYKYMLLSDSIYINNENTDYIYCVTNESNTTRYDTKYFDKAIRSSDFLYNAIDELGLNYLKENIDRYRLYQLYRQVAVAINTRVWNQYRIIVHDIVYISRSKEYCEVFKKTNLKHININLLDRWLLQSLKDKKIISFKLISFSLYCRQRFLYYKKK